MTLINSGLIGLVLHFSYIFSVFKYCFFFGLLGFDGTYKMFGFFYFNQFTWSTEALYVNCSSINFRYAKYIVILRNIRYTPNDIQKSLNVEILQNYPEHISLVWSTLMKLRLLIPVRVIQTTLDTLRTHITYTY